MREREKRKKGEGERKKGQTDELVYGFSIKSYSVKYGLTLNYVITLIRQII